MSFYLDKKDVTPPPHLPHASPPPPPPPLSPSPQSLLGLDAKFVKLYDG